MEVHELKPGDESAFEAFFAIYESALVKREQKPKLDIKKMSLSPEYIFLLAYEDNIVMGFSIIFVAQDNSFCLLEYMAIAKTYRGAGFGGKLFNAGYQHVISKSPEMPMLIELDSARENAVDQNLRSKRLDFYRRLGCLCLQSLDYLLPLPGEGPVSEMELLSYQPASLRKLEKSRLAHWLKIIYQQVYHCPADDVRIEQMLSTLSDSVLLV